MPESPAVSASRGSPGGARLAAGSHRREDVLAGRADLVRVFRGQPRCGVPEQALAGRHPRDQPTLGCLTFEPDSSAIEAWLTTDFRRYRPTGGRAGPTAWYPHAAPQEYRTRRDDSIPTPLVGIAVSRYTRMSMDDLYRDYILEHYRRPHNFGVVEDADASYEGANPLCGDRITLMLGVKDGIVDRVGFTGRGCAISQASASLLTDEIKGKPLTEVAAIRADDLLDLLGIDISPARLKCAMLSHESLQHVLGDLGAADPRGGRPRERAHTRASPGMTRIERRCRCSEPA